MRIVKLLALLFAVECFGVSYSSPEPREPEQIRWRPKRPGWLKPKPKERSERESYCDFLSAYEWSDDACNPTWKV